MSGELLKRTDNTEKKCDLVKVIVENTLDKVTQTLCPEYYSEAREGITYGKREAVSYYSNTTKCERKANILLPADYDENKKYPVLYFLHGIFGDENSMLYEEANKLDIIYGNLKADGVIDDAIIVFPNMFASDDPKVVPGFSLEGTLPYDNFINDLADDLIPFIEGRYSVVSDKAHRGLIGFSMGGRETIFIGLMRSDIIGAFAAIAPAPGLVPNKDAMMEHKGQFESEEQMTLCYKDEVPELAMICCGTKDGVVGKFPASYDRIFTQNGIDHMWYEVPEADHDSNAIRSGYYNFLIRWTAILK